MTHEVVQRVEAIGERISKVADETEQLGKLSEESVRAVKEAGVMRMLQPTEHGGYAAHPADFAEAVMATAKLCGSTGWVTGVGGVHPWEFALMDSQLQEEVWGQDPDTWIASPYAPGGVAVPVDGGYKLSGRWPFSSGTDHSDWVVLGALVGDAHGKPVEPRRAIHVVLPRSDYTIDHDSWQVMGLKGTGSKDVNIEGAFVPEYRTIDAALVAEGEVAAERAGRTETVYKLPFWSMFPLGITSAVIGIAEGALAAHLDYQSSRVNAMGAAIKDDPIVMSVISEAAAEIQASRIQLIDGISRMYDTVEAGQPVTLDARVLQRRNQVRACWRAVDAVDEIFARSGGNAVRSSNPIQRFWRDAHVGLQHAIHTPGAVYHGAALHQMGVERPDVMASAMV